MGADVVGDGVVAFVSTGLGPGLSTLRTDSAFAPPLVVEGVGVLFAGEDASTFGVVVVSLLIVVAGLSAIAGFVDVAVSMGFVGDEGAFAFAGTLGVCATGAFAFSGAELAVGALPGPREEGVAGALGGCADAVGFTCEAVEGGALVVDEVAVAPALLVVVACGGFVEVVVLGGADVGETEVGVVVAFAGIVVVDVDGSGFRRS